MSLGVFLNLALLSAILALGQWFILKVFGKKMEYMPLFGSILVGNMVLVLLRGIFR